MNIQLAHQCLIKLAELGVKEIILCAGARNAPLVYLLEKSSGFNVINFFEERSAGFFGLARTQATGNPVAIITTSGTAVAELLPAAVEATYTRTPLIFVTADRPRSYRGTGSPQSIDQVGIFYKYVETCIDVENTDEKFDSSTWSRSAPLQMNICFSEPLIDAEIEVYDYSKDYKAISRLMPFKPSRNFVMDQAVVIAGPMSVAEARLVSPFLEKWGVPIYAEAISNLRSQTQLLPLFLKSGDHLMKRLFASGLCKSVIRIGGVPTLRFWRDLEEKFSSVPVLGISNQEFSGLSRSSRFVYGLENLSSIKIEWSMDPRKEIFTLDQKYCDKLSMILQKYPKSEPALLAKISKHTHRQNVYIGNSLPIREWDLVSGYQNVPSRQTGNRGANGIDGQISSYLGGVSTDKENWGFVGDLTALYDLSALWASQYLQQTKLRLVVINNSGGMIFKEMFKKNIFLNQHKLGFGSWADMWGWEYQKLSEVPEKISHAEKIIFELIPDLDQSEKFWAEYRELS